MKFLNSISALCILILVYQTTFCQLASSVHNFSSSTWNTSGEMCIVCHTPHNSNVIIADAPLWNHSLTAQTFTLYGTSTLDATVGQPDGSSKLCLSCHDGVTAVDNFGGVTIGTSMISGTSNLGSDLRNDHPISFLYDAALAGTDGDLNNPITALSGITGTIDADMLFNGKMQCASCHDVHNGAGITHLLLKSNAGSALCLTCHAK